MICTFSKEPLHIDDVVVYLKNERTGSSTIRKCKFIGQIVGFTGTKAKIHRFSKPNIFVTPDKLQDLGVDTVCSDDVVHIIISKYQDDMHLKTLNWLNSIAEKKNEDIKVLLGKWFSALEDEGVNPWMLEECIKMASKYWYTEEDYKSYLNTIA